MRTKTSIEQLKTSGQVTTANKVTPPKKNLHIEENLKIAQDNWMEDIEKYCFDEGLVPQDLIAAHKALKKLKVKREEKRNVKVRNLGTETFGEKNYSASENPFWKKKMGIK